jgi:tRNA pseudouridine55 synthase
MTRSWRAFDGVLLFDKPLRLSSNSALQKVRHLFYAEKAGHTGTLDPLATGLLPICFGEATKFSMGLLDADKTYKATMRLGQTTTTGDAEGEVLETHTVSVSEHKILEAMQRFLGPIQQLPPMHSALKHQGKPLYEYIRKGETIERETRPVFIHMLTLEHREGDQVQFTVRCSKGTYVRTLAEDIGRALGCGAHLIGLRRIAIAQFSIEHAYSFDQLELMDSTQRDAKVLPLDALVQDLPRLDLDEQQTIRFAQGQKLGMELPLALGKYRLYSSERFIGVGEWLGYGLAPSRLLGSLAKSAANRDST